VKPIRYSAAELAWIKRKRTTPRRDAYRLFCEKFGRSDVSLENFTALCKRNGWLTGRTGRFDLGIVPWTKGKKLPYNENSARTQFKKGQCPHNTKYLGHERVQEDGYTLVSVDEKNPHTGYERRYVLKHKYLWEKVNGPVPDGMCLKCIDGNKFNMDPSNWELIPRGMLPLMNGFCGPDYQAAAPEVRPAIMALAKLRHARGALQKNRNIHANK
jgi:hypothetical protein